MNISEEDRIRLLDITDSIREIQGYVGRGTYDDFSQREDVMQAVSSHLLQIGGAAALLSDDFKDQFREIDWDVLKGLQYANFDHELELDAHPQWHIISNDLPELMDKMLDISTEIDRQEELEDDLTDNTHASDSLEEPQPDSKEDQEESYYNMRLSGQDIVNRHLVDESAEMEDVDNLDVDNIDLIDDSYIDQRFTDEDLMEGSSLDDQVYDEDDDQK
jgi:uncharacterized protein with HEPN domain